MKRLAFIGGIILLLAISIIVYYHYNQLRQEVSTQHTDITITSGKLYQHYNEHEQEANKLYLNKVIEVKGNVSAVQNNNGMIVLLMNAGDGMGGINCSLKENNLNATMQQFQDKEVVVKGKCTGFLMDVNLVDCVLVQAKNN